MPIRKAADIRPSEITSKDNYFNRRKFIQNGAIAGGSLLAVSDFGALVPTELRIGSGLFAPKQPSLIFNGYGEHVAHLYEGLDLRRHF